MEFKVSIVCCFDVKMLLDYLVKLKKLLFVLMFIMNSYLCFIYDRCVFFYYYESCCIFSIYFGYDIWLYIWYNVFIYFCYKIVSMFSINRNLYDE